MPAAALRERRGSSKARAKPTRDRARARVVRPAAPATSKLKAARGVGLGAPAAAMASLLTVLLLVAGLATGGRGAWLIDTGERWVADMTERFGGTQGDLGGGFANLGFRVAEVHLQGASRGVAG